MSDLLLRDTDRNQLVAAIAAEVVKQLKPLLEDPQPEFVDGDRMAELAGVSRPTIDRLRSQGVIPSVTIGRRRLYAPQSVIAALAQPP